jgi:uncharacterized protein
VRRSPVSFLLLLLLQALPVAAVSVEDIPSPRPAGWTVDLTGLLYPGTVGDLNRLGDEVQAAGVGQLAVVVVDTTDGAPHRQFATELANRWGIGDVEKDNGVLVFAAIEDRAAEIVLGDGIDDAGQVTIALDVMHSVMLPRFRSQDPSGAIVDGAHAVAQRILGVRDPFASSPLRAESAGTTAPARLVPAAPPRESSALPWLAGAAGLGLLAGIGLIVSARRPRQCPECHVQMLRLDEAADDEHLAPAELTEERLGSVDYDVWLCAVCDRAEKVRRGALFTRYATCPRCSARTVSSASSSLREPTTWSEGLVRVEERCQHCDHHHTFTRRVPQLEERERWTEDAAGSSRRLSSLSSSSSSSRSSSRSASSPSSSSSTSSSSSSRGFGGGSSSGGGASGRW